MNLRRTRSATVGSVAVTITALLLASCSGSPSTPPATSAPSGQAIKTVAPGEVTTGTATGQVDALTWYGDYRPPITLDPVKLADYPEETVIPNLCEPALRVAPDYTITGGVVEKFGYTDKAHYELTVRDGVRFTDGKPVTAEDVAYSLNRNRDPKVASNYSSSYAAVTDIKATDAKTVVVTLKHPSVAFTTSLGTLAGAVVQKEFTEKAGQAFGSPKIGVTCTGPFSLDSYDGTSKLVLKRNDDYWDTAHKAFAGSITFVYPTDPSALAKGLTSGEIDGAYDLPSTVVTQLAQSTGGDLYLGGVGSSPVNVDLLMTKSTGPGADPRVRQALSMAIDREGIAKAVWSSTADPLYKVSGPGLWGYAKDAFQAAYDPLATKPDLGAATKLIEEAGAKGKTLVFGFPSGDVESSQLATVIQQEGQSIGLDIKLNGIPSQQYGSLFADPKAREPFDMILTKNYVELPEPLLMDQNFGLPSGNTNFSGYANDDVTAKLAEADQITDNAARAKLVIEAEAQLAKDLPSIPIVTPRSLVYTNNEVTGATLSFSYMTSPWAAAIGKK